ncbi:hypothetical protein F4777DRAFT_31557 [Nemania sp. FL0916]|nr:hypothetical protein F4777DRAFT_31557 [Nemania sp. FL0916]
MHLYFLGLTVVGFDVLWGSMVRNGTAKAIGVSKSTGILPSGSPLIRTYTGIPALDAFLQSPVIFYDALEHGQNPVYKSLLVGVFTTMQSTSVCMLVNGWKNGHRSPWAVIENMFWGVFNQSHGAAFVYPLYCLFHLGKFSEDTPENGIGPVDPADAEALFYTSVVTSVLPIWLLYPAFVPCSSRTRQLLIASYRLTPIITSLLQPALAATLRRWRRTPLPEKKARSLVLASLTIAGTTAAAGHMYAVCMGLLSGMATLRNIFSPWATEISGSNGNIIAQGCHLFLQNDWLVIASAFIPYAASMLRPKAGGRGDENQISRWKAWASELRGKYVSLTSLTLLLSPGAVLPLSLATRV